MCSKGRPAVVRRVEQPVGQETVGHALDVVPGLAEGDGLHEFVGGQVAALAQPLAHVALACVVASQGECPVAAELVFDQEVQVAAADAQVRRRVEHAGVADGHAQPARHTAGGRRHELRKAAGAGVGHDAGVEVRLFSDQGVEEPGIPAVAHRGVLDLVPPPQGPGRAHDLFSLQRDLFEGPVLQVLAEAVVGVDRVLQLLELYDEGHLGRGQAVVAQGGEFAHRLLVQAQSVQRDTRSHRGLAEEGGPDLPRLSQRLGGRQRHAVRETRLQLLEPRGRQCAVPAPRCRSEQLEQALAGFGHLGRVAVLQLRGVQVGPRPPPGGPVGSGAHAGRVDREGDLVDHALGPVDGLVCVPVQPGPPRQPPEALSGEVSGRVPGDLFLPQGSGAIEIAGLLAGDAGQGVAVVGHGVVRVAGRELPVDPRRASPVFLALAPLARQVQGLGPPVVVVAGALGASGLQDLAGVGEPVLLVERAAVGVPEQAGVGVGGAALAVTLPQGDGVPIVALAHQPLGPAGLGRPGGGSALGCQGLGGLAALVVEGVPGPQSLQVRPGFRGREPETLGERPEGVGSARCRVRSLGERPVELAGLEGAASLVEGFGPDQGRPGPQGGRGPDLREGRGGFDGLAGGQQQLGDRELSVGLGHVFGLAHDVCEVHGLVRAIGPDQGPGEQEGEVPELPAGEPVGVHGLERRERRGVVTGGQCVQGVEPQGQDRVSQPGGEPGGGGRRRVVDCGEGRRRPADQEDEEERDHAGNPTAG